MASQTAPYKHPFVVKTTAVDGLDVFYREAGSPSNPTFLLLHGYPSSSHQFRHLLPILAQRYHVLAPDLPGFGFTNVPDERNYVYTFDNLARTISAWLDKLQIRHFMMYVFDYGSPVGFRLALQKPDAIKAIVTQNGNAYKEGIGPLLSVLTDHYNDPSDKKAEQAARDFISHQGTKAQYVGGSPDPSVIEPESYWLDAALLARPGNVEIQMALFRDYKTNPANYSLWHKFLEEKQPPVLAVWGKNDQIFVSPGAEAFKQHVPNAEVHLLDGGHFLLETHVTAVGDTILGFLKRRGL